MSLGELLKTLQKEYLSELPERISVIDQHIKDQDIEALKEDFHKLKGTGKTYGIPEISELGEKMEGLFLDCPAKGFSKSSVALDILSRIHSSRVDGKEHFLRDELGFSEIKKAG